MRLPPESGQAVPLDGSFRSEPTQAPRRRHSPEALRAGGAQPGRPLCCTRARRGRGRPHVRLRREVVDRGTGEPPWANEPRCCSRRPLSPPRGSKSQRRCAPSPKGSPESARGCGSKRRLRRSTKRIAGAAAPSAQSHRPGEAPPTSQPSKTPPAWAHRGRTPPSRQGTPRLCRRSPRRRRGQRRRPSHRSVDAVRLRRRAVGAQAAPADRVHRGAARRPTGRASRAARPLSARSWCSGSTRRAAGTWAAATTPPSHRAGATHATRGCAPRGRALSLLHISTGS